MLGRALYHLFVILMFVFLVLLLFFRITTGSFEGAGARMDVLLGQAADETAEVAGEVARETEELANDLSDGDETTP